MRDDKHRWTPQRDKSKETSAPGVTIKALKIPRLTMVSGTNVLQQTSLSLVEWPEVAQGEVYAISLRRDRLMEVNGPQRVDGWDADQALAISNVSDAFSQVEVIGPNALSVLRRGTELDLSVPSRSAIRLLFGLSVFLYRHGSESNYRVHVASGYDEALWHALTDAARHLD